MNRHCISARVTKTRLQGNIFFFARNSTRTQKTFITVHNFKLQYLSMRDDVTIFQCSCTHSTLCWILLRFLSLMWQRRSIPSVVITYIPCTAATTLKNRKFRKLSRPVDDLRSLVKTRLVWRIKGMLIFVISVIMQCSVQVMLPLV